MAIWKGRVEIRRSAEDIDAVSIHGQADGASYCDLVARFLDKDGFAHLLIALASRIDDCDVNGTLPIQRLIPHDIRVDVRQSSGRAILLLKLLPLGCQAACCEHQI